jgi:hypothetical protein
MHQLVFRLTAGALGVVLMVLSGCARTQPSRFYLLQALPNPETEQPGGVAEQGPVLGIGPVMLPKYLDQPQIVTRASPHELTLAEFDRWAESLEENVTRVLAENLSLLVPTDRIALFPWPRSTPIDYQVTVEIMDFLGQLGRESTLIARWSVWNAEEQELVSRKSRFSTPVQGQEYEALVAAMSHSLVELSQEIAVMVKTLMPKARKQPGSSSDLVRYALKISAHERGR